MLAVLWLGRFALGVMILSAEGTHAAHDDAAQRQDPAATAASSLSARRGSAGQQHLGLVHPVYRGDLARAVSSLRRWPTNCSPVTQQNVDLVLYYAEGEEDSLMVAAALETIGETAGRCFSKTRTVYAHLDEEDDVYPRAPSVMFYKMFLDNEVRSQLSEYAALAILEWDVLVASDRSFEQLYRSAFAGGPESFWMKGSNLESAEFHEKAAVSEMWSVLGHLNGNAIYNNRDPAFVEYVGYTRERWGVDRPYDVALWLTISDFPYSWPLWQRYSGKFVASNLISYVGNEHVDHDTVSTAVSGHTLFIHGSRVDEGSIASVKDTRTTTTASSSNNGKINKRHHRRRSPHSTTTRKRNRRNRNRRNRNRRLRLETKSRQQQQQHPVCSSMCGGGDDSGLPSDTSTVCDRTCSAEPPRYGGFLCGASDENNFGASCRLCYVGVEEARKAEKEFWKSDGSSDGEDVRRVIMCDTMRPPEDLDCSDTCTGKRDAVCDESCGSGLFGDYNCNWRSRGEKCRFCFDDVNAAVLADSVAMRHGGRVIMCSTLAPPCKPRNSETDMTGSDYVTGSRSEGDRDGDDANVSTGGRSVVVPAQPTSEHRSLHNWKKSEKWKRLEKWKGEAEGVDPKWMGDPDNGVDPKWKVGEDVDHDLDDGCDADLCDHVSADGTKGRVCDLSCEDGIPYGTRGCSARAGAYGSSCRVCYYDKDLARSSDTTSNRAIMCDTVEPITSVYSRNLVRSKEHLPLADSAQGVARRLQKWRRNERWKALQKWRGDAENGVDPKWKVGVDDGCDADLCDHVSTDGTKGRVCDLSCEDGIPYGTTGCSARAGAYGSSCRVCYYDEDLARSSDTTSNRAIMCDTVKPVTIGSVYTSQLSAAAADDSGKSAAGMARKLLRQGRKERGLTTTGRQENTASQQAHLSKGTVPRKSLRKDFHKAASQRQAAYVSPEDDKQDDKQDDTDSFFSEAAQRLHTSGLKRGDLCAFVAGRADEVYRWEVTVLSILQFVPGMRVAVAAESGSFPAFKRVLGGYPGVSVSATTNALTSSLHADDHCGAGTRAILYLEPASVISRPFTSKDTHSPHGDLLVVYSEPRSSHHAYKLSSQTAATLGFQAPSFAHGTDLMLPVGANGDLRDVLASNLNGDEDYQGNEGVLLSAVDGLRGSSDISIVPQMMAALQYSRNTPGVWFFNPQAWVAENLFKPTPIWDIPLVKPRYTCAIASPLQHRTSDNPRDDDKTVAGVLQRALDFLSRGGTCENGQMAFEPEDY